MPTTWEQVQAVTKFLKGKQVTGLAAYGFLDPLKAWGGFGFYFLGTAPPPTPSIPTTRPGCSIPTP